MVKSINAQYHLNWDGYLGSFINFFVLSFSNFFVPFLLTLTSSKNLTILSTFIYATCYLAFLYPVKYALNIISFVIGFCGAVASVCQKKLLIENSTDETLNRNSGEVFFKIRSFLKNINEITFK